MDHSLSCYSSKGKRVWVVRLPAAITCIERMDIPGRGLWLVAVALASKQIVGSGQINN